MNATTLDVAKIIANQIGHKALYMIGAKSLAGGSNYLQFRIMRNASKINLVKIELTSDDLYNITYYSVRGIDFKVVTVDEGYYADMLTASIRNATGLNTSL